MLNEIMKDKDMYNKVTNNKYKKTFDNTQYDEIDHYTINYIDDSTNLISHNNSILLERYLDDFYKLLVEYYNTNNLKINDDKTVLCVVAHYSLKNMANQIKFKAGQFNIEQKSNIKILGYILNSNLSHEHYLNTIISKVNYRLHTFGLINRYMCQKIKILVVTSIIYSIIRYSCAIMTDLNCKQIKIFNVFINKAARKTLGFECY